MKNDYYILPPIYENPEDWPTNKLSLDRHNFIKEIDQFTFERLNRQTEHQVVDMIALSIYQERIRMKEEPWKVDPPDDTNFWRKISKALVRKSLDKSKAQAVKENNEALLRKIIHRYSEEIVGTFKISTFLFARRFLTFFFGRLLNAASGSIWGRRHRLYQRLKIYGDIEKIKNLFNEGTVVVVPTHFSNVDSILVGYVMDILGMPPFTYGAGLNLYNSGIAAYFMNRLGSYRLDRRKKNQIYLETLKAMSNLAIQRGIPSLFFPGGTRSRAGNLENKLKMGLLGTVVEAQRQICQRESDNDKKVFVVPLVMSYHFVLEAPFLIEQHLKNTGKERYFKTTKDDFYSFRKIIKFAWQFFSEDSELVLSFGKPIDVLGNFVDEKGASIGIRGENIDIKEYFMTDGKLTANLQREAEYTKVLADKIVERYFVENIVLSSHLVAFTAFNMLKGQNPDLDLYAILRLPPDDYMFPIENFEKAIAKLQIVLNEMEKNDKIKLSEQINWDTKALIKHGISELGVYHTDKPLRFSKEGNIVSDDFHVLYYYHNRLEGYGLIKKMQWAAVGTMMME